MRMKINNKYIIGCNVMFYEIEMLPEYVNSIIESARLVDNRENIVVNLCWNKQEYLERLDTDKVNWFTLDNKFYAEVNRLEDIGIKVIKEIKTNDHPFYNIAQHRREFNNKYCESYDFLIWGETDSLFPREMFDVIENISRNASQSGFCKYIINFADRKNWDASWDVITHPKFENVTYIDELEWLTTNEASSKSYMTYDRMCEINDESKEYDIVFLKKPKFDGSCLVISNGVILAGANIPPAITHCAEDTSLGVMAEKLFGDNYVQFCVKNILRVHNRRHPKKRMYILNEDNPMGFVGSAKGDWWNILENTSKYNMNVLFDTRHNFMPMSEVLESIKQVSNA